MRVLLDMLGEHVECCVPETAADVLDYRLRVRCIADPHVRMMAARQWFLDHVVEPPEHPKWPPTEGDPAGLEGAIWVHAACEVLCEHASLEECVVADVVRLEDRKAGIPEKWRPTSKCDCVRCRWNPDDGPLPEGADEYPCLYDGIDPRAADVIGELAGATDLSQPYWAHQVWSALRTAQWRKWRHDEEERERNTPSPEYLEAASELGDLLKGGRRG